MNSSKLMVNRAMRSFSPSKPKLIWGRVAAILGLECNVEPGVAGGADEESSNDMMGRRAMYVRSLWYLPQANGGGFAV